MGISSWICTKSTKNMLVKIVHPGGHIELHDRPVLAAEVMLRNPKCILAYPHVFRQPWAIVAPDTMLQLGQKFYVVPINTIRKLQRKSIKCSLSPITDVQTSTTRSNDESGSDISSTCWMYINKNMKSQCPCLNREDDESKHHRNQHLLKPTVMIPVRKQKHQAGCSDTKELAGKRNTEMTTGSPSRFTSVNHLQPNLDSIVEEY